MTPHEHQPNDSELNFVESVAAALKCSTTNDSPSPQAIHATILALQKLHNTPELVQKDLGSRNLNSQARLHQGRKERMLRIFRYSGLAAAVMILLAGIAFVALSNRNTVNAFEQAKEKARTAKSVSYRCVMESGSERKEELHFIMGDLHRREARAFLVPDSGLFRFPPGPAIVGNDGKNPHYIDTLITNYKTKESMQLEEYVYDEKKTAKKWIGNKNSKAKSPLDEMNGVSSNDMQKIGEEIINGRKNYVYDSKRIVTSPDAKVDIKTKYAKTWIDAGSGSITRAQVEFVVAKLMKYTLTLDNFKWNEPIDDKLFSFDVPEGYTVISENDPTTTDPLVTVFGQVIENVKKANSVRFTMSQISRKPNGGEVRVEDRYQCLKTKGRHEVHVADDQGKMHFTKLILIDGKQRLDINHVDKKVKRQVNGLDDLITDMIQGFGDLEGAEFAGVEKLNGVVVHRYRFAKIKDMTNSKVPVDYIFSKDEYYRAWINPTTQLPVRVEMKMRTSDGYLQPISIENFEWNVPLNEKIFKLEVPEGYKVIEEKENINKTK